MQFVRRATGDVRVEAQTEVVQQFHIILSRNVKGRVQLRNFVECLECGIAQLGDERRECLAIFVSGEFLSMGTEMGAGGFLYLFVVLCRRPNLQFISIYSK